MVGEYKDLVTSASNAVGHVEETESRRVVWCRLVPLHPLRHGASRLMKGNPVHLVCTWRLFTTGPFERHIL